MIINLIEIIIFINVSETICQNDNKLLLVTIGLGPDVQMQEAAMMSVTGHRSAKQMRDDYNT